IRASCAAGRPAASCACTSPCTPARPPPCAPPSPPVAPGARCCPTPWPDTSHATACTACTEPPPAGRYNPRQPTEHRPLTSSSAQVIKTRLPEPPPPAEVLLRAIHAAVGDLKARDVIEIDVRGRTSVCDYMVIASGTS